VALNPQYHLGIATGVPLQFLSVGGPVSDFATALLDTTTFIDGLADPPTVVSTSYSENEEFFGFTMAQQVFPSYVRSRYRILIHESIF
jgi:tripeptidyl-peptidase-1